jgi:hypothetical protein
MIGCSDLGAIGSPCRQLSIASVMAEPEVSERADASFSSFASVSNASIISMLIVQPNIGAACFAADFRNSPLSITGIPQGTSGAEGLG